MDGAQVRVGISTVRDVSTPLRANAPIAKRWQAVGNFDAPVR